MKVMVCSSTRLRSLVLSEQAGHQSNRAGIECELHEHLSFKLSRDEREREALYKTSCYVKR